MDVLYMQVVPLLVGDQVCVACFYALDRQVSNSVPAVNMACSIQMLVILIPGSIRKAK